MIFCICLTHEQFPPKCSGVPYPQPLPPTLRYSGWRFLAFIHAWVKAPVSSRVKRVTLRFSCYLADTCFCWKWNWEWAVGLIKSLGCGGCWRSEGSKVGLDSSPGSPGWDLNPEWPWSTHGTTEIIQRLCQHVAVGMWSPLHPAVLRSRAGLLDFLNVGTAPKWGVVADIGPWWQGVVGLFETLNSLTQVRKVVLRRSCCNCFQAKYCTFRGFS